MDRMLKFFAYDNLREDLQGSRATCVHASVARSSCVIVSRIRASISTSVLARAFLGGQIRKVSGGLEMLNP